MFSPSALLAILAAQPALAAGFSTDIELLRPSFSPDAIPGVDTPIVEEKGAWRAGLMTQYEEDPLILYDDSIEIGPIVQHRATGHLGLSYAISESASVRVVLPMHMQSQGAVSTLSSDGFGLGDASLAARFKAFQNDRFAVGLRGEASFPSGRKEAYMGEDSLRTGLAVLGHVALGPVSILADIGAVARTPVETDADFTLGSELIVNGGLRYAPLDRVAVYAGALSRAGFSNLYTSASGENPVEGIAGLQLLPTRRISVDLGAGRGLADGYGTTQQRIFLALTHKLERRPVPEPVVEIPPREPVEFEVPEINIDEIISEEQEWQEGELARVVEEQIVIRDPIQFEFNTEIILSESIPTLQAVAGLLKKNDRIGHLVVEGHASEEGDTIYNYDLSIRRSRAVWEQLILGNVHPERLSYRGMGEVEPKVSGSDEASLAINRRVEFHIVYQLGALDRSPTYPEDIRLPWSGQNAVISPPPPGQVVNAAEPVEREVAPEEQLPDADFFLDDEEDSDQGNETEADETPEERQAETDQDNRNQGDGANENNAEDGGEE